MKFKVNSEVFKQAAEKAAVLVNKKSQISYCYSVKISADADKQVVTVTVNNMEEIVDVFVPAEVLEAGYVSVDCDILKRIFNIKGTVTISTDDKSLKCTNGKKSGICAIMELEALDDQYSIDDGCFIVEVSPEEFTPTVCNVAAFADPNSIKPANQGVYFDLANGAIVALDGYRLMQYSIKHWHTKSENNILVKSVFADHIKKIIGKDKVTPLRLYADGKFFFVSTTYMRYRIRIMKEEFLDYKRCIPSKSIAKVSFEDDDLVYDTIKEYADIVKSSKDTESAYVAVEVKANEVILGVRTPQYSTVDRLPIVKSGDGTLITGYNPQWWLDILKIYKHEKLAPEYNFAGELSPLTITAERYSCLLLPARIKDEDGVIKFFTSHVA